MSIVRFCRFNRLLADSEECAMPENKTTADRLATYSDAVFAVIVTIMVLELKAPDEPSFSALRPLWPTAISYAVSYLFIAIIWMNHHYLMRFVGPPTLKLMWINFVHLFMVSLLPFATAWVARTRLASSPVAFYAGVFVCIDIAYNAFEREVLTCADHAQISTDTRRMARRRSLVALASFTTAMVLAFAAPRLAMRSDLRCPTPSLVARRRSGRWAGAFLYGLDARHCEGWNPPLQKSLEVRLHNSMTISHSGLASFMRVPRQR
jgi:uncharacterized membrane protein